MLNSGKKILTLVLSEKKNTFAKNPSIQIQNNILSCEETVKLLGIDKDYQLKFDQHIRDRPFNLKGGK
jgi:hypothetical protein